MRKRLGIAEGALVASFRGTFGTWHGVDFLGEAIRQIVDTDRDWLVRNRLHCLVIGDGLKMPEIKRSVGDEPYRQFVTLAGLIPQKDAPAYLAASDLSCRRICPTPTARRSSARRPSCSNTWPCSDRSSLPTSTRSARC